MAVRFDVGSPTIHAARDGRWLVTRCSNARSDEQLGANPTRLAQISQTHFRPDWVGRRDNEAEPCNIRGMIEERCGGGVPHDRPHGSRPLPAGCRSAALRSQAGTAATGESERMETPLCPVRCTPHQQSSPTAKRLTQTGRLTRRGANQRRPATPAPRLPRDRICQTLRGVRNLPTTRALPARIEPASRVPAPTA